MRESQGGAGEVIWDSLTRAKYQITEVKFYNSNFSFFAFLYLPNLFTYFDYSQLFLSLPFVLFVLSLTSK